MNRKTILLALALSIPLVAFAAPKADIEAGKSKSVVCQACHGVDGNGIGDPQYPLLAGQYADYLEKALRDYRSGDRANPIMAGFASTLSDEDIVNLAAYFASQETHLIDLQHVD
jgi:cytochrome c553